MSSLRALVRQHVNLSLYYLDVSVVPEESCIEESCLEESSVEPEQDDDSIRVKIADLGNACWVVRELFFFSKFI